MFLLIWLCVFFGRAAYGNDLRDYYRAVVELQRLKAESARTERQLRAQMSSSDALGVAIRQGQLHQEISKSQRVVDQLRSETRGSQEQVGYLGEEKRFRKFVVSDLKNYQIQKFNGFFYDGFRASKYTLQIDVLKGLPREGLVSEVRCQGSFQLKAGLRRLKAVKRKAGNYFAKGRLFPQKDLVNFSIMTDQASGDCWITIPDQAVEFFIRPIDAGSQQVPTIGNSIDLCRNGKGLTVEGSRLAQTFFKMEGTSLSCSRPLENLHFLEGTSTGLSRKVERLLGIRLSDAQLFEYRPDQDLDFSHAPRLTSIWISTLEFKYDLTGSLLLRLLEYHANRGADVRLMTSEVLLKNKDRKALMEAADRSPHFQVRFFNAGPSQGYQGVKEGLASLHRVNHIKLFLVTSAGASQKHFGIFGGRNLSDGYNFLNFPDLSRFPDLVQHRKEGRSIRFKDFEYELDDADVIKKSQSQFFRLWNYSKKPLWVDPSSLSLDLIFERQWKPNTDKIYVRKHMSYPLFDGQAAEDFIVQLIESSQSKIQFLTPYFNPSPRIERALRKALNRKVQIEVITRISLDGDTFGKFVTEVNKKTVNRFYRVMEIYDYTEISRILHTKMFLFDDDVAVLGSMNLNQRTFFHDTENATYIFSPAVVARLRSIVDVYRDRSEKILTPLKKNQFYQLLIKPFSREF